MYPGRFVLCLKTVDLEGMMRFYEALGMTIRVLRPNSVMAWNGDVHLALMTFLGEHSMNFRGADPFEVQRIARETGIEFEGEPQRYGSYGGRNWLTHDPDGNNVFFDTNESEIGETGRARFLLRILDSTRRQLVDIEASETCREVFESEIVRRFVTPELEQAVGLELTPLPEPGRFPGHFTYCLKTTQSEVTRDWYRALGLEVGRPSGGEHVHVGTSDCSLELMSFLPENCLNFRGADVFRVYDRMRASGLELEGRPERYAAAGLGPAGAQWQTRDPDGNLVYLDTADPERIEPGDPTALRRVLECACRQLRDVDADPACIEAIQSKMIGRFAG